MNCRERSGIVRFYEIHPQLKAGRSIWRICRHASHLFDLQEQLSSLNVKKNRRSVVLLPSLARYGRVVATHAYEPSAYDVRAENAVHVNLCLC